jgi:LPS-assembly protein
MSHPRKIMLKSNLIALAASLFMVATAAVHAMDAQQEIGDSFSPGTAASSLIADDERPSLSLDKLIEPHESASATTTESTTDHPTPSIRQSLRLDRQLADKGQNGLIMDTTLPDTESIIIEGDRMEVMMDRKMQAIGNATLFKENQKIFGDRIEYDIPNDELHVIGNSRIEFEDLQIWGPEMRLRLYDNVGEMKEPSFNLKNEFSQLEGLGMFKATDALERNNRELGSLMNDPSSGMSPQNVVNTSTRRPQMSTQAGNSRGDAKTIFFEGENKKRLESARFTTCEVDQDDWYIKASELEIDNYTKTATAWNARVEFMDIPLLYTPWLNFSFLNQRKTGFLSPTIGTTSRSGFEVLLPFYWNIAPNMDATLGTRFLSKRGTQLQGEFRYLDESYGGLVNAEYLPSDNQTGESRYFINLQHDHNIGNGWSAGYRYEKVSDDEYFSELSTRITVTSRVNLPQQGYVNYADDVWQFNGLVQKYQTLDNFSFPYERLPQLTLRGNKEWDVINADLYTQWVNFDRDPTEPARRITQDGGLLITGVTGTRFTAYPSISMPFERPYGFFTPKFGIHHTRYGLDNESFNLNGTLGEYRSDSRTLPIFSLDTGLYFDREMRVVNNRYTQTLEPRLFYVYIPYRDQSMFPIFDTAEADLNMATLFLENQFIGNDRINDANQLTAAISTRLIDSNTGIQRLAATVGQRFYFSDQRVTLPGFDPRDNNTSDTIAAATLRLNNDWNIDAFWQYNTDRSTTVRGNLGTRYNPEPGKTLNLGYRYFEDRLEQFNASGQWPLGSGWYAMGRMNYSILENRIIESLAGVEYNAGCWQARTVLQRVSTVNADANYALFFQLELGGLASIGSNPLSLLERGIPGYTTSGMIANTNQKPYE